LLAQGRAPDDDALSTFPPDSRHYQAPEGANSEKDLVVSLSKVVGKQGETVREGKWVITKIAGL
jgi:hypothetical protein